MKKITIYLFRLLFVLFAINSFAQTFIEVSKVNNGQTIFLNSDQILKINLPRNPSSGYVWCESTNLNLKSAPETIAKMEEDGFVYDSDVFNALDGSRIVGQAGTQVIKYVGSSTGTTILNLVLKRSWEKQNSEIDSYTITIVSNGKYSGTITPILKSVPKYDRPLTSTYTRFPSKFDWRSKCTPIPDQQHCGDCWAYAGVGTFECNIAIHDSVIRNISEEYITNCYTANGSTGCNGGYCPHGAWMSPLWAVYETDCPWTTTEGSGTTEACGGPYPYHETIDTYKDVIGRNAARIAPVENIKAAIYNYGPTYVTVKSDGSAWQNYSSGILVESGTPTNHAVVLVGWCDTTVTDNSGGYWILRNSWGTSWGQNGYVYITYGSDAVGSDANYIVYKGGIIHKSAPVTFFGTSSTTICNGTVQFVDSTINTPTSWRWDFGDTTTSTLQNPIHTYTKSGVYTVVLTATNNYGNNIQTKTNYITVNLATAPLVSNASCNGPCSVTLNATGTGNLYWYSSQNSGTLIGTGSSYSSPTLSTTTTYYVQNEETSPTQAVGIITKSTSGGYYSGTGRQGEIFNAVAPIIIKSVTVYASTSANRTIFLKDITGTVIDSITTNIGSGMQTVDLNFNVPQGNGYTLGCSSANYFWRESIGIVYPYTTPGLVSIIGSTATTTGYYYYFYNWQVEPAPCLSAMTPVVATINSSSGIIEKSDDELIKVFPNPNNGQFTVNINNSKLEKYNLIIENVVGKLVYSDVIENNSNQNISLSKGVYFLRLIGKDNSINKKIIVY